MKISQPLKLCLIVTLVTFALVGTTSQNSTGNLGAVISPPPFQLIDLSALLKSLNLTYQQVAQNLSTLNGTTTTPISTPTIDSNSSNLPTYTNPIPPQSTTNTQTNQNSLSVDSNVTTTYSGGSNNNNVGGMSNDTSNSTTTPTVSTDNYKSTGVTTPTTSPPLNPTPQSTDQSNNPTTPPPPL